VISLHRTAGNDASTIMDTSLALRQATMPAAWRLLGAQTGTWLARAHSILRAAFAPSPDRRRARDAAAVLALAARHRATDPGYAADLEAAAIRHLGEAGLR
jgi:hypothetical protein